MVVLRVNIPYDAMPSSEQPSSVSGTSRSHCIDTDNIQVHLPQSCTRLLLHVHRRAASKVFAPIGSRHRHPTLHIVRSLLLPNQASRTSCFRSVDVSTLSILKLPATHHLQQSQKNETDAATKRGVKVMDS
jgi:hypothetical protein